MPSGFDDQYLLALLDLHDEISLLPSYLSKLLGEDKVRDSVIYWKSPDSTFHLLYPKTDDLLAQIDVENVADTINGRQSVPISSLGNEFSEVFAAASILVPLYNRDELSGLWILPKIEAISSRDLFTVARYLSIGLEHGRVIKEYTKQNKRLRSLVEAGEIFTSQTSLENVLQKLVQELHNRFGYSAVAVLMLEGDSLRIAAAEGFKKKDLLGYTFKITRGITGRAAREGEDQLVENVAGDDAYIDAGEKNIRSEMAVPIRIEGKVLGVLDAQSDKPGAFEESDVSFLHVIARQAAIAIQKAKLFDDLESTKEYLDRLVDSSGDAIFAINKKGEITTWNSGAKRIYGYSTEEALGKSVDDLVDPDEHSRSAEDVIRLVRENNGIFQEDEVIRKRKNGETFPTTATYTILQDDSGVFGLSIIEKDLTFIKQATKLDAAKTLISTITHYINNAITPLNGRAQIAEMQPSGENIQALIQVSLETTQKIQEVITTISEMKEFITTPYYNMSYIINLEEQLKKKLAELKSR